MTLRGDATEVNRLGATFGAILPVFGSSVIVMVYSTNNYLHVRCDGGVAGGSDITAWIDQQSGKCAAPEKIRLM